MVNIKYDKLFKKLNESSIKYLIFKGIEHIEDDLCLCSGDIDILIGEDDISTAIDIFIAQGFLKSFNCLDCSIKFYSLDVKTGKTLMLDVYTELPLYIHHKASLLFKPDFDDLFSTRMRIFETDINVISDPDRTFYSYVFYKLKLGENASQVRFNGLTDLRFINSSILKSLKSISFDLSNFSELLNKKEFQKAASYLESFSKDSEVVELKKISQKNFYFRKFKRFLGEPPNKVHAGLLMSVVGVDGAGKSTLIDRLENNLFLQATGVKSIYFGYNNFKLPLILWLYQLLTKNKLLAPLRIIPAFVMTIERRLRILRAKYLVAMGNLVICDRYYYDDEVYYSGSNTEKTFFNRVKELFRLKVRVIPDISIYLDVSPDMAFQRKQDFNFDKMKEINTRYKEYMKVRPEVIMIDANKEQDVVFHEVLSIVFSMIIEKRFDS